MRRPLDGLDLAVNEVSVALTDPDPHRRVLVGALLVELANSDPAAPLQGAHVLWHPHRLPGPARAPIGTWVRARFCPTDWASWCLGQG